MCKFHEDVAIDIATDPITGEFRPGVFGVARMVLARYHVEQYDPRMFGMDGRSIYAMASRRGVEAFNRADAAHHLSKAPEEMVRYRNDHISVLHQAINAVMERHDLSVKALGLPKDPIKDPRVLDEGAVELIEGYTADDYYGDQPLHLKKIAHKPSFEPLRSAAEDFLNQPDVEPILKTMMDHSIVRNFLDAREKVDARLLGLYEKIPPRILNIFNTCASCGGSIVGPHLPCIGLMVAAGSSSVAASIISNPIAVPVMSILAAGGGYLSWQKLRSTVASPVEKLVMKPAFALAAAGMIAMHLPMFGHHHGSAEHEGHEHSTKSVQNVDLANAWKEGLKPSQIEKIEQDAKAAGLTASEFMNPLCITPTATRAPEVQP